MADKSELAVTQQVTTPAEYAASLMQVIASAASNPSVDIEKMERLIDLQIQVEKRHAEVAFAESFAEMQPELPVITMNGAIVHKGQTISEFSDWPNINKVIAPILSRHGFSISFKPAESNKTAVTGILRHKLGHKEEATLDLPTDTSGAKNAVQAVGSSLTYGKRYVGVLMLNLTIEGEDDDGSSAAPKIKVEAPRDLPFPQGPAKNKSELKALCRTAWRDIESVTDLGSFDALLDEHEPLLQQMREALPSWWTGGNKEGETYEGLSHVIERVRRDLLAAENEFGN